MYHYLFVGEENQFIGPDSQEERDRDGVLIAFTTPQRRKLFSQNLPNCATIQAHETRQLFLGSSDSQWLTKLAMVDREADEMFELVCQC